MTNYQELLRAFEAAKSVRDAAQRDFKRAEKALMDFYDNEELNTWAGTNYFQNIEQATTHAKAYAIHCTEEVE